MIRFFWKCLSKKGIKIAKIFHAALNEKAQKKQVYLLSTFMCQTHMIWWLETLIFTDHYYISI